jgi:hypothetical protein
MQGDWDSPGVESNVYISGNFTIMTQEMADQQDPKYRENDSENGAFTSKARCVRLIMMSLTIQSERYRYCRSSYFLLDPVIELFCFCYDIHISLDRLLGMSAILWTGSNTSRRNRIHNS